MTGLNPLHERPEVLSEKLFNSILWNPSHKLYRLLPSKNNIVRSIEGVSVLLPHGAATPPALAIVLSITMLI